MTYRSDDSSIVTGKCSIKNDSFTLCSAMDKWLGDSCVNEKGKTNYIYRPTVLGGPRAGFEYYKGVVAYIPKSNGLMLNFCPWCGSNIANFDAEGVFAADFEAENISVAKGDAGDNVAA